MTHKETQQQLSVIQPNAETLAIINAAAQRLLDWELLGRMLDSAAYPDQQWFSE